jgi:hypothetical protein
MVGVLIGVYAFFFAFGGFGSHASVALPFLCGVPIGGSAGYSVGLIVEKASRKYKPRRP